MRTDARHLSVLAIVFVLTSLVAAGPAGAAPGGSTWNSAGGNRNDTRFAASEHKISPQNVGGLQVQWELTTGGEVSATPAVDDDNVYVPDSAGNIYAVDRESGAVVWSRTVSSITGVPGDKASATPAISGDSLVLGNLGPFGGGGKVFALDKHTGAILWVTQLSNHVAAAITQSATIFDGTVYVGVDSLEDAFVLIPGYPCCSFRGSFSALDLVTGALRWTTTMAPPGFSGNAVTGSSPAIDTRRHSVYIATGNNYSAPLSVLDCVAAAGNDPAAQLACVPADNYADSILSLDMRTGAINWVTRALPYDAWNFDCVPFLGTGDNCPDPAGPDHDFAQAPALFTARASKGKPQEVVGAGSESGKYWALDPATGATRWTTQAGPAGTFGGLGWGSAVDDTRVYVANANSAQIPSTLPDASVTTAGIWSALDNATGQILWQTTPPHGGSTTGPVTTANGVMFGCSLDPAGYMYALDAKTGAVLWSYASGGSCASGAAISKGSVYWGSGYSNFPSTGTPNNRLYAFSLS